MPYISILLQLGLNTHDAFTVCVPDVSTHGMDLCPAQTESNQYCINFQGCSHNSFGVIDEEEDDLFQQMLSSQEVLECHPRDHECCVNVVAAMKPIWQRKKGGVYDWFRPTS